MYSLLRFTMVLLFVASPQLHASESHSHDHSSPGQLMLDNGKKWPTDESLSTGMVEIKNILGAELKAIHNNKLEKDQYAEMSDKISASVESIFKNCKLNPKADAMLHVI